MLGISAEEGQRALRLPARGPEVRRAAPRRASRSASTGSARSPPARRRCATSSRFPKTTSGIDLMTKAPADVLPGQLARARPRAAAPAARVSATPGGPPRVERIPPATARSGSARACSGTPRAYLVSPSGRFLLVAAGLRARGRRSRSARPSAARLLLDFEIEDGEAAKTLDDRREDRRRRARGGPAARRRLRRGRRRRRDGRRRASPRRSCCAASRGTPCRRRPRPAWPTPRSAGRRRVNHPRGKNLLGAFHPPAGGARRIPRASRRCPTATIAPASSRRTRRPGSRDAELAARAADSLPAVLARESAALVDAARGRGARQGRRSSRRIPGTRGGGICSTSATPSATRSRPPAASGALRHGEAVAWGIAAALEISTRRAGLPEADAAAIAPDARRSSARSRSPSATRRGSRRFLALDKKATAARDRGGPARAGSGAARVERSVPPEEWLDAAAIMSLS